MPFWRVWSWRERPPDLTIRYGRGAVRVFTRPPPPPGVAPDPSIPSGKAIVRRYERGGSTDQTGLGVATLTGQVGSPIVHQSAPSLEEVRTPIGCLDPVLDDMRQRRLDQLSGPTPE